jgi:predicted nucleotidyltransferase
LCDINVYVELERPLGWKLFELKEHIEEKLGIHIDILTPRAIKPALKEEIMASIHYA